MHCTGKLVFYIVFFSVIAAAPAYAVSDSISLPPALVQQLAADRQQDDLELWIYDRIAYVEEDPAGRIDFLMRTQQEAWRKYKTYEERLEWFNLLVVQGYYQLQTGNILSSVNAYENALQFYESYPLPDADIIEYVLKPLGNNYTRLADYNTALFIHGKTLALALKSNQRNTIASVYSNMAICTRWQGNLAQATEYCSTGIRYASRKSNIYGLLLSTWADILDEQDRYDTAAIVCRQALQQLQDHREDASALYWYTAALQVAAKIALHRQQYAEAVACGKKALAIFQQYYPSSRQREKAKTQVLLGDICYQTGHAAQSLQYYQDALKILLPSWKPVNALAVPAEKLLYSENTLADALSGKAAALLSSGKKEAALQHYMAAFMAEKKLRSAFFYTESKLKEIQVTRSRVEAAMKLCYNLWKETGEPQFRDQLLLIAEISRAQVLMDERRWRKEIPVVFKASDSLFRKSKQLQEAVIYYQHELLEATGNKHIAALLQAAEYELSLLNKKMKRQAGTGLSEDHMLTMQHLHRMLQRIPGRVSVLEFFAGRDSSFIMELDNTGISAVHLIPQSRLLHSNIQHFMQQWFAGGPSAMINAPRRFYNECYGLYSTIFKGIQWKKERSYILMPDGMFSYLPFDALLTDSMYRIDYSAWPYLFKQVSLSQAYSLQTWYEQQSATYQPGLFAAFFVSKGKDAQQPALAIEEEYQVMKEKISGNFYMNVSATWDLFNQTTDAPGILHISTHAVSSARDSFPYLQLYDQPFYLSDLRYKHFVPALVVLSACKTADGLLLEGEGVNSISRGFTAAGAGGVVSGLWNVNDRTAIAIMQLFYEQLQQQNNPAMALHKAKLQWLQTGKDNSLQQLPYYWAGFVYSGHLKQLKIEGVSQYRPYYWLLLLLVLPVGVYFFNMMKRRKSA